MNVREWIENIEWYKGGSSKLYSVSASKIGGELLPIWLSKKFDKDKTKRIGLNYQGSAFHYGMEWMMNIDLKADVFPELKAAKTLTNGWLITGTADLVDKNDKKIHDYKTTSASGYKLMQKAAKDKSSQLAIQGATLSWLNDLDGKFFAEIFIRDFKPWRKDHPVSAYQQIPVDILNSSRIEIYLIEKTTALQNYIDADKAPPECENLMWIAYEGNRIKLKCEYYCDYKSNCPYYKKSTNPLLSAKLNIGGW